MADDTFSLILFSGTDDELQAAAVLAVGAAAMGRPVDVFLQYWALDAFREDRVLKDHGLVPEAGEKGARAMQEHGAAHWIELFEQAKDLGGVTINACADSMEIWGSSPTISIGWSTASGARPGSSWRPPGATTALLEAEDAVTLFI